MDDVLSKIEDEAEEWFTLTRCLIAGKDMIVYKDGKTKGELWEQYYTQAPAQRR